MTIRLSRDPNLACIPLDHAAALILAFRQKGRTEDTHRLLLNFWPYLCSWRPDWMRLVLLEIYRPDASKSSVIECIKKLRQPYRPPNILSQKPVKLPIQWTFPIILRQSPIDPLFDWLPFFFLVWIFRRTLRFVARCYPLLAISFALMIASGLKRLLQQSETE